MNREFRVWNPRKKQWEDPLRFAIILDGNHLELETDGKSYAWKEPGWLYKYQQWTGLTDSRGKKVFEGDIVCENITQEMAANRESANVGQIFFAAGTFMINGDGPLYDHVFGASPDRLEDYLVIGNILENPELLQ